MSEAEHAPGGIDITVPHSARMYDYWIGGKDNFAVDRAMGEQFARVIPSIRTMARENRNFMERAVRYLVREAGLRQFLDIGTGIPTQPNVHELAREIAPETRVVYVDNDPIVLAHARALLENGDHGRTTYIDADVRSPRAMLAHPALLETLDLQRPVGLLLIAVLMLVADADEPRARVGQLLDALPSGSYVAITHPSQDFDAEAVALVTAAATQGGMTLVPRTRAQVERLFHGWELVPPGIVPVMAWRPDGPAPENPNAAFYWSGVARKR
jgi:hypothetical protein